MTRSTLLLGLLAMVLLTGGAWAQDAFDTPPVETSEEFIPFDDNPDDIDSGHGGHGGFGLENDFTRYRQDVEATPCRKFCPKTHGIPGQTLILLGLLLALGTCLIVARKRRRWISLAMLGSLIILGFWRHGCICPVGSVSNISAALVHGANWLLHRGVIVLFLLPLIFALLFGRIFCGTVCPLGAIQHLLARKKPRRVPAKLDRVLRLGRWAMLIAVLVGAMGYLFCTLCYVDPFLPIFQLGGTLMHSAATSITGETIEPTLIYPGLWWRWAITGVFVVLCVLITRPFCRWVCPYGVLLGLLSKISFRHRRIEQSACVNCKLCTKICPTAAIDTLPAEADDEKDTQIIDQFNCVSCGACSDVCPTDAVK